MSAMKADPDVEANAKRGGLAHDIERGITPVATSVAAKWPLIMDLTDDPAPNMPTDLS
ncbi:hypothetical protein Tasa_008_006 [Tanticharoenia sakaeratensis NBRC 103193]|uniref:Uncharacterized protein n=1 Tax=Tanticharoenia sakaeratensis NBRC 103193 TaxID=1231623 RepID=A0A0D6MI71_9PROT|nr:hypothetical protein Tasa_008_006 [Tanticharoenia sakaeratensis NBRC 103193]GBQ24039.1 hypothetical protein AA103193_2613 [Tanticharoenia sakaeratensis NBRC 103193]